MTPPGGDAGAFDPLAWWGRHEPDRVAVHELPSERAWTYGALHAGADAWVRELRGGGITSGDRVALLARNRVEHLLLLAACARLGAILVPLNWRLAPRELARVLADCRPALVYGGATERALGMAALDAAALGLAALGAGASAGWRDLEAIGAGVSDAVRRADAAAEVRPPAPSPEVAADSPAMLLYTSGSTGAPKGVIVPHRQLHWNASATVAAWRLHADHVALVMSPFFHTAGWGVFALPLLSVGGRLVLLPAFAADAALDALARFHVTHAFGVPTQWQDLVATRGFGMPLPHLAWFLTGGAPCPRALHDAVTAAGYPFREGFGLTECGPNCFATTNARALRHPGSVGDPLPHLGARLARDDGRLVEAPGEPGELQLRGPQLFGGYWANPHATAEAMTDDGWFRTGDVLSVEPQVGWRVRGRRKEMYISGGENVFPGEVEAALLESGLVAASCVVGVPDARWGEVGEACVVLAPGVTVDDAALRERLRDLLAAYKVPHRVHVVDALPRLGSGKVDRAAVALRLRGERAPA